LGSWKIKKKKESLESSVLHQQVIIIFVPPNE
jgi:hypothetical protein